MSAPQEYPDGADLPRPEGYGDEWPGAVRDVLAALAAAGHAVVRLPEPDGLGGDGLPEWRFPLGAELILRGVLHAPGAYLAPEATAECMESAAAALLAAARWSGER